MAQAPATASSNLPESETVFFLKPATTPRSLREGWQGKVPTSSAWEEIQGETVEDSQRAKRRNRVPPTGLTVISGSSHMIRGDCVTDEPPSTRQSLLIRLRDLADEEPWSEFMEIDGPLVYRLARRRGLQHADADDLAQEVFRAVARAIERYDPDPNKGSFRGWLSRIARNLIINLLAARRRHPQGTGDPDIQRLLEDRPDPGSEDSTLFQTEYQRAWSSGRPSESERNSRRRPGRRSGRSAEGRPPKERRQGPGMTLGTAYQYKSRPSFDPARGRAVRLGFGRGFLGDQPMVSRIMRGDCSESRLKSFLNDRLPEPEASRLCDHLDDGEECRQTLERLAAGSRIGAMSASRHTSSARSCRHAACESRQPSTPTSFVPSTEPKSLGRIGPYDDGGAGRSLRRRLEARDCARPVRGDQGPPSQFAVHVGRSRFARTAAAAAVVHENVVAIHAVSRERPLWPGRALHRRLLAPGTRRPRWAAGRQGGFAVGMQARGLAAAHDQGLVHRTSSLPTSRWKTASNG